MILMTLEKILTLNNVMMLIKSALNSDLNQYYNPGHNIL